LFFKLSTYEDNRDAKIFYEKTKKVIFLKKSLLLAICCFIFCSNFSGAVHSLQSHHFNEVFAAHVNSSQ